MSAKGAPFRSAPGYRHVKRYLKDDGLFAQWLQVYELDEDRAVSVIKAVSDSFDDYLVIALDYGNLLIVARPKGAVTLSTHAFARLAPRLIERLHGIDVASAADATYRVIGNKRLFQPWLEKHAAPANSDFHPYLDTYADRDRFTGRKWMEIFLLGQFAYPIPEFLGIRPAFSSPSCLTVNRHFDSDPTAGTGPGRVAYEMLATTPDSRTCPPAPHFEPSIARKARELVEQCMKPPMGDAGFAATALATRMLPYLSPAEGTRALAQLADAPCLAPARPEHQAWPDLLRAIADRSPERLAAAAETLLAAGQGGTRPRAHYLLTMAMLGAVAAEDYGRARRIWETHSRHTIDDGSHDLPLDILQALAFSMPR